VELPTQTTLPTAVKVEAMVCGAADAVSFLGADRIHSEFDRVDPESQAWQDSNDEQDKQ